MNNEELKFIGIEELENYEKVQLFHYLEKEYPYKLGSVQDFGTFRLTHMDYNIIDIEKV